ncbi:MAG: hypothetical protein IPK26_11745 [Planctomycetes bacterium]|nr:hypothetical protein [Planctomycetota bacterium]
MNRTLVITWSAALLLANACLGPSRETMIAVTENARQQARTQLAGGTVQPGTGMWKVNFLGETHRWLIVRDGDRLHIEPVRRWGLLAADYWVGTKLAASDAESKWRLERHQYYKTTGTTSPNVGVLEFGDDHRVMKVTWEGIRTSGAGLLDILVDELKNLTVTANGTLGEWPNP